MSQLSIIVPAFNRADLLEICLGNLLAQIEPGDEILVVDDASHEEAQKLLQRLDREHPPIKVYRLNRNYGQGHARNHGAGLARNPILVFVDSDVDIGPGNLMRIRHFFSTHANASAVTGRLSLIHPYPSFFSRYKNTYMNYIFGLQSERVNFLYGSICAVKKVDFMPWPEKFLRAEDSELGMRMSEKGKELYFLPELEVIHFKNYSFRSLVKNDFFIPFGFARCFWLFEGWKAYIPWVEGPNFSHIKKEQVYSLIFVTFGLLSLVTFFSEGGVYVSLGCLLAYIFLNRHFWAFLWRHEGPAFTGISFLWTFFDQFVMMIGAVSGLIYHGFLLAMKVTNSRDERVDEHS